MVKKLSRIAPTQRLVQSLSEVRSEVEEMLKGMKSKPFRIAFCGSSARSTFLRKGKKDLDFFLYYLRNSYSLQELTSEFRSLFQDVKLMHSGFPYFRVRFPRDYVFHLDLVICEVDTVDQRDRTQLHNNYVKSNLTSEVRSQILVLKHLLKKHKLYGADSSVRGFSGYCVQCLLIKYRKIQNIPSDLDYFEDPVDCFRNLMASVSKSNLLKFHVLKQRNFKGPILRYHEHLYYLENPPLRYQTELQKDPHVVSSVYTTKVLIVELTDLLKRINVLDVKNPVWSSKEHTTVYFNSKVPMKRYSKQLFLKRHPEFQRVDESDQALKYQKCYSFLK